MNRKILFIIVILLLIIIVLFYTDYGKSIIDNFSKNYQLTVHLKNHQKEDVSLTEVGVYESSKNINDTIDSKETDEEGLARFTLPKGRYYIWVADRQDPDKKETIFFPGDGEGVSLSFSRTIEVVVNN